MRLEVGDLAAEQKLHRRPDREGLRGRSLPSEALVAADDRQVALAVDGHEPAAAIETAQVVMATFAGDDEAAEPVRQVSVHDLADDLAVGQPERRGDATGCGNVAVGEGECGLRSGREARPSRSLVAGEVDGERPAVHPARERDRRMAGVLRVEAREGSRERGVERREMLGIAARGLHEADLPGRDLEAPRSLVEPRHRGRRKLAQVPVVGTAQPLQRLSPPFKIIYLSVC